MSQAIDLDPYFRRIGHIGAQKPDLETLASEKRNTASAETFFRAKRASNSPSRN
jgi:hypothetical protein